MKTTETVKILKIKAMMWLIIAIIMLAALISRCAQDEVSGVNNFDANAIGFEISAGKTRANIVDLGYIQSDVNGFGIYATKGNPAAEFIGNKAYKYESGVWKWAAGNVMWPTDNTDYPVNFYAYYPKNSASLTSPALTANYTIPASPAAQTDFLAASSLNVLARPASGNVNLAFKHILSKVDFKVITGAYVAVDVQSIAAKSVGAAGAFNFANLSWLGAPAAFGSSFSYMTAPANPANYFEGATSGANVAGSSGSLMLMPQDLSGRGWNDGKITSLPNKSYIEVVYRVKETGNNGKDVIGFSDATKHPDYTALGGGVTGPLFIKAAYTLSTNWQMSKAYTYSVQLGTTEASGGILICDTFIDKNGNVTNLPVKDPNTGHELEPEKPIIDNNKPIGFDVEVADWGLPADYQLK